MVYDARLADVSISQAANLPGFFKCTTIPKGEWFKHLSSLRENAFLMPEVRGELTDCFVLIERKQ